MNFKVLVTATELAAEGLVLLEQSGAQVLYMQEPESTHELGLILASQPVDAIIARTVTISAEAMAKSRTLKVISKHGVGFNNIDVAAATALGIPVFFTPGVNAASVAEMTIGLLLAAARRISWMDKEVHAGRWSRLQHGIELQGKTIGLVGLGQVGRRVALVCQALGMRVLAFSPSLKTSPLHGVELCASLEQLLQASDVLSLHLPLTAQNKNLLGAAQFALMPRGAILINTARGELVNEVALAEALQTGQLYAAGIDTTVQEPLPDGSALRGLQNLVITPHVAGSTPAALAGMASGAARNLLDFLRGQSMQHAACANRQVLG